MTYHITQEQALEELKAKFSHYVLDQVQKELLVHFTNHMLDQVLCEVWISVKDKLPPDETPVLILLSGIPTVGELRWEHPSFEDTFKAFRYWDSPTKDGQAWEWLDITHWMPLPNAPKETS